MMIAGRLVENESDLTSLHFALGAETETRPCRGVEVEDDLKY